MSIYQASEIRGHTATELTPQLYQCWGRALGNRVARGEKFVVGGDVRGSTPCLLAALCDGLCQAGVHLVDLGFLPTPMVYYAQRRLQAAGCAVVTASHYPSDLNGLKWIIGTQPPTPEEVAALKQAAESPETTAANRKRSEPRPLDISFDYVAWLQETFVDSLDAHLHIVVDPMHGSWAGKARRYLQAVFPQCLFSTVRDQPRSDFGGDCPDCSQPNRLAELCQAVYHARAHLGIALDGDGDRIAVVDNRGVPLSAEETTWALLESFGEQLQGKRFVYDLRFSSRIAEVAEARGAEALIERGNSDSVRARMVQAQALFGAETGGHYFFGELDGADDGLFAACRLIALLARRNEPLAELRRGCPEVYVTPDLHLPLPPEQHTNVIEAIRQAWVDFPQQTLDGLRVDTPAGWALIRSSPSEPALTFRFESIDWHALDDLVDRFCDKMADVGEELWLQYQLMMGHGEDDDV